MAETHRAAKRGAGPQEDRAQPSTRRRGLLAIAAGLLLVATLAGCADDAGAADESPTASKGSSVTLRAMPEWDVQAEGAATPIEPGSYLIPSSPWSVADFTANFPAGWTVQYGHVYGKHGDEPDELGFYAVVVDKIYADSCAPENERTQAVGPGVDDLYVALLDQTNGAEISEPVNTTLGGRPATRFDLTIPKRLEVARCRLAPYGLQIWYSEPADKHFVLLRDATASVYVVEVDGKRQVFLAQVGNSASAADRAELQTVLDSLRIGSSS